MPKQITKTVYTFRELLDASERNEIKSRAVERAREWLVQGVHDFNWFDSVTDTWNEALEQIGFESPDIRFSGFWSQGDGASFTCKSVDIDKLKAFMAATIKPNTAISGTPENFRPWLVSKAGGKPTDKKYRKLSANYCHAEVERISHHYSHAQTCKFNCWAETHGEPMQKRDRVEALVADFGKDVEQLREDLCRAIYKDLEEEYGYQTSEEQLVDVSNANDYTFDQYGHREG
jgi:hypothetical protein